VRLPTLSQLQCPADDTQACSVSGSNLFLIEAVSTDPGFANPAPVPDGYTGTSLALPRLVANTLFLRLRDDPTAVDSAIFPPLPNNTPAHPRHAAAKAATVTPTVVPDPTTASPPAAKQTGPATSPGPSR
jgi:hypothetical protein